MEKAFQEIAPEQWQEVARALLVFGERCKVWTLNGQLGAGKTSLVKALCKELGVLAKVQSPTFSIVNVYDTEDEEEVYHFDCYRLKNTEEALDFGIEEYFESGQLCFVEWPDNVNALLPEPYLEIEIQAEKPESRNLTAKIVG
ncbi:tRNA (adenosine(37)-N6)-threonylcarbamoyltransferase complex ATPase subunit type 1 TsaE [Marinilongibacter aquaticus]|uniref:tRNA (adenosine(37)-N6)-threonylcarbamoyltransferase complex ATPase subunit type 1 TsaE n=1 Tax=Marinilongibacter aquaticus TaxID=2975157 RepID=UPI0021BDDE97|nr:tRNA (adenosine(37)-N6)-threonylcarbamoyltransferase complex ATPase subunit type 1 TsaE [Marinilongibacter aquaticus]UBM60467.1 tRNA (adenosine(37)-N6)-threonylcarbamoyltransferase complex ATPase subunit type 1 TsaE [Marinilongibacter aquaticus]